MTLAGGLRLGPYEIIAPIGAGGMGEVYRARDTRLDRDVAIKVLPERTARDEHALSRFRRETKALAALSHPNILMILDVGEHEGVSYAVMELLEGETLRRRLEGAGVDPRKALEITAAIADGLAAAHARDIIHRDLKPENLFLTKDGVVKILDFGLARTGLHAEPTAATVTAATVAGVVLGTVNYMSPEQVRAEPADAQSDLFSLGCVLYEMLTGQPPFVRETSPEIMTAILRHHPKHLSQTTADVPPDVDPIVMRCLEKRPEERFNSARDLAFSIRNAMAHGKEQRRRGGLAVWVPAGFIGLLAVAAGVFDAIRGGQSAAIDSIDSIAVLPFVNASGDPEQEYFADGMTEALIADLAKIRALKVISSTSVMQFKGVKQPLPAIAKSLNVDVVVEGSVLRAGDRVRITAQLIHGPTDKHLWAESYDRDLGDILRLQSELAGTIADKVKVTLTRSEQDARPINPEAYQAYLKGRFHWNKRTCAALQKAITHFEQAVSVAPDWALGYAGLADAHELMPTYCGVRSSEAIPKARAAATQALRIDDSLAEAHATLATIAADFDWDWRVGEEEYQRALQLSPNYAQARAWYGMYLVLMGRHDEGIKEAGKAQELDPLSVIIGMTRGWVHYMAGDFEEAEGWARKMLELEVDLPRSFLSKTLCIQGKFDEALKEARQARSHRSNSLYEAATLGYVLARAGDTQGAREILDELTKQAAASYVAPGLFAQIHAGFGDRDLTFDWLERAYQERGAHLVITLADPLLAPMRTDPRFEGLTRRVGLPPLASMPAMARQQSTDKGESDGKIMLAVLPFENLSRDPEQEYFSDGLTEEMIAQLGRINPKKLGVIARSSAMHYKNTDRTIEHVRRELGVDYVIEGSVRRADNRVRITANLIQCSNHTQLWADSFERELKDILALQSDIARAVAQEIKVALTPQEQAQAAAAHPVNPEAYQAYVKGRFFWNKRTSDALKKATEHFEEAVRIAPDWPLAYVGLADSYLGSSRFASMPPGEAAAKARAAATKALELDPLSGEAHLSLAWIATTYDWDWPAAERAFTRSLELSPNYATGHQQFALHLLFTGRHNEALQEINKAHELDPLSLAIGGVVGLVYSYAGDFHNAESQYRRVLELDPNFALARINLARGLVLQGRLDEAVVEAQKAALLLPDNSPRFVAQSGYILGKAGRKEDARKILDQFAASAAHEYVAPTHFALVHFGLDERDRAFEWLEKAYEGRDVLLTQTLTDPYLAPVRGDPRWVGLVRRVGLPMPKPISPVLPLSESIPGGLP